MPGPFIVFAIYSKSLRLFPGLSRPNSMAFLLVVEMLVVCVIADDEQIRKAIRASHPFFWAGLVLSGNQMGMVVAADPFLSATKLTTLYLL
jgi:hypothetical protein